VSPPFSAVLLAGGESSRMGRDKAFLEIDGVPLWSRQIGTLAALRPRATFIAGPRHAAWINAGCEIVNDARENAGPLAALVASLRRCATPLLLALAVDLPEMPADYLRALIRSSTETTGVVPKSSAGFEPLAAVYPIAALPLAESRLRAGNYALQDFVAACVAENLLIEKAIRPDEERFFRNLNTLSDLSAIFS
jgi:molybdenum cofactor guanylyltransferase